MSKTTTDRFRFESEEPVVLEAAGGEGKGPPTFSGLAYSGGLMNVSMYSDPVVVDLAGIKALKGNRPMLMGHDDTKVVGHSTRIAVGKDGIQVSGVVSGAGESAREVVASAGNGFPWRLSIGAQVKKREFVDAGSSVRVNGRLFRGPIAVIRAASLYEISFVSVPGDAETSVSIAARLSRKDLPMDFMQWLQAKGFVADDLTEAQTTALKATFDAETAKDAELAALKAAAKKDPEPKPDDGPDPVVQLRAKMTAETRRIQKITELCDEHPDIQAKAIDEGWDAQATELAVLKARLDAAPAIHVKGEAKKDPNVLQAAFCTTLGLPDLDKQFKPEVLEAADRYRGYGIQEILLDHAIEGGYRGRMKLSQGNIREVLHAAFSVHSITTMLTMLGHKTLLSGFYAIPQTWREIATTATVSDFKEVTAFRLTADLEYEQLAPHGEIQHGTLGQESYTMQAHTYAKMLTLGREDLINDDLGAFNDVRRRLGMGCALAVNKRFWTVWLAAYNGAAFWTAARGNLVTGSALGDTGITAAVKAFRNLAGPDGNKLNLNPDRILIPPDLEATALKYYNSTEMRDTTASTKTPVSNIYYNRFRPIVVPELSTSSYTGYSATTWYMMPTPDILASASVCFLNGVQTPVIESADADFSKLGIEFRGYHDFGVQMTEYRASVACKA